MYLPLTIGKNRGSFMMILPKAIGMHLELDVKLKNNKNVKLIAETVENGALLRYPTEEEIERFGL